MEVNGAKVPIVLQNILLCVQQKKENHTCSAEERKSYRFATA